MTRILLLLLLFAFGKPAYAQINPDDSTAQILANWRLGDKLEYHMVNDKYRVENGDTSLRRTLHFDIEVVITDSTADSYIMEWRYIRPDLAGIDDRVIIDYLELYKNHKVVIRTDEYGNFLAVENWEDIRDSIQQGVKNLLLSSQTPNTLMTSEIGPMVGSRAAIENGLLRDIRTFFTFFGQNQKLGESVLYETKVPNLFGGTAFDAELEIRLDDINFDEQTALYRQWQTADPDQVAVSVAQFLRDNATRIEKKEVTDPDFVPLAAIEERTAARIHVPTGWVMESAFIREADLGVYVDVFEVTLEAK
jgi:hypothetical protein